MANVANWFEIPVLDLDRARAFYGAVLDASFHDMGDASFFNYDGNGVGGHLQLNDGTPSDHGVLLYLNAPGGVAAVLAKVIPAGGKVEKPSTSIGPHGYIGIFHDSEGNRVGLHSQEE